MFFFFQAEDGIRDHCVTGVQTCALPIYRARLKAASRCGRTSCSKRARSCASNTSEPFPWSEPLMDRNRLGEHFIPKSDRKSTRLNSSHTVISYAVFCLKKKIPKRNCYTE